jgi:hypothetical protein
VSDTRLHYWWIPDWKNAYRDAEVYLAPHIKEQAGKHINDGFKPLDRNQGYPWDESIATLTVSGSFMTEVEFFHRPSRSLILTDFIENFEPEKLDSPLERWLCRLGGVLSPNGGMPRDMRMTFRRQRPALKAAITTMISWNPERIVIAHGRWFERDGADALRRSFAWVLDRP